MRCNPVLRKDGNRTRQMGTLQGHNFIIGLASPSSKECAKNLCPRFVAEGARGFGNEFSAQVPGLGRATGERGVTRLITAAARSG